MDLNLAEDSKLVRMVFGLTIVVICLSVGFHHALKRTMAQVSNSLVGGLVIVDHVDNIMNQLDRLTTDQRAFLSTGDDRFAEVVVESIMGIDRNLESLEVEAKKNQRLREPVGKLSQAISWVMDSMGKSFQVQQTAGAAVAIAYLDDDASVDGAKDEAARLRRLATDSLFDRMRSESKMRSILNVLF
jgi:CHASE3 domain sensor protein